jgi:hypothetical protein
MVTRLRSGNRDHFQTERYGKSRKSQGKLGLPPQALRRRIPTPFNQRFNGPPAVDSERVFVRVSDTKIHPPYFRRVAYVAGATCQIRRISSSLETQRSRKPDQHPRSCAVDNKVHFRRFDSLLTPLSRCFSHFPHGTFALSELHVNNQALESTYPPSSHRIINLHYSLHMLRDRQTRPPTRILRSLLHLFQGVFESRTHTFPPHARSPQLPRRVTSLGFRVGLGDRGSLAATKRISVDFCCFPYLYA